MATAPPADTPPPAPAPSIGAVRAPVVEYGFVGLSEEQAVEKLGADGIELYHSHFCPLEWALPAREPPGGGGSRCRYVKLVCARARGSGGSERVLGLHVLAPRAAEIAQDIQMHRCRQMVANVTFFQDLPMHVIMRIVVRLSLEIYMTNEVVVLAGTLGSSMYFISSGTVVIYSGSGNEICHLDDGAHFGEIALLSGDQTRIASVVAIEPCELYVLRRDAFLDAVAIYPRLLTTVEQTAFERLNQTVAMDQKSRRLTTFSRQQSTRFAKRPSQDSNPARSPDSGSEGTPGTPDKPTEKDEEAQEPEKED